MPSKNNHPAARGSGVAMGDKAPSGRGATADIRSISGREEEGRAAANAASLWLVVRTPGTGIENRRLRCRDFRSGRLARGVLTFGWARSGVVALNTRAFSKSRMSGHDDPQNDRRDHHTDQQGNERVKIHRREPNCREFKRKERRSIEAPAVFGCRVNKKQGEDADERQPYCPDPINRC